MRRLRLPHQRPAKDRGLFRDITDQKRAEARLRESEARLAFLDRLGAETAPLADADAVLATTTRLLGEHLNLSVCAYADMDEDQDGFTIRGDWAAPGSTSIVGHYSLADFGKLAVKNLSAGLPLVVNDNLRELAPEEAATFQNIGIAATICMPLVKEGRLTALMAIHDRVPRLWTEAELSLLREVTARSWAHVERVAATAELRASEARFREFGEAASDVLWIADAATGHLEYLSPAFERIWGEPREHVMTDINGWAEFLHPDDREAGLSGMPRLLAGKRVTNRVPDRARRWRGALDHGCRLSHPGRAGVRRARGRDRAGSDRATRRARGAARQRTAPARAQRDAGAAGG